MVNENRQKASVFKINREVLVCLFLILTTLLVYWQVRKFSFVNLDDHLYVTENPTVLSGLNKRSIIWAFTHGTRVTNYWAPITWLTLMFDSHHSGIDAGGYHMTNMFFHIANTLLLFFALRKMTGHLWRSGFVAVMFALHPLHVESVAWVTERKDMVSTFFWMLSMWSYAWYVKRPRISRYLLFFLFFFLGLMSKPMLVTLPFVLLLLDYWPLKRMAYTKGLSDHRTESIAHIKKRQIGRLILEKIPLFIVIAITSVATYITQQKGGAVATLKDVAIIVRIENVVVSYVWYIKKMIWPCKLSPIYIHPGDLALLKVIMSSLVLLLISFWAIRVVKRRPWFIIGWLWYVGTLVPVIGFIVIGPHAVADRYTYIPLIGLFIIIAWEIPEFIAGLRFRKVVITTSVAVLLSVLIAVSWQQARKWKDTTTLFGHALKITEDNYVAHHSLGVGLASEHRFDEAITHFSEALRLNPRYAEAHYNKGLALANMGKFKKATIHYYNALKIRPNYLNAHNNLGAALLRLGNFKDAITHFSRALKIKPRFADAHNNMGVAMASQGEYEKAIKHFSKALRINPKFVDARNNLKLARKNRE